MSGSKFIRNSIIATPFYVATIVPFLYLAIQIELSLDFKHVLFGALGWWVALLLRLPLIALLNQRKLSMEKTSKIIVGASGPIEETVRLGLLLLLALSTNSAFSVGVGWATIEIVYGLVQLFGLGILDSRNDEKATEAKTMMRKMGMDKILRNSTPFWGALERLSANALHISFSLLLVLSPLLAILTAPIHSMVNFFVVKANKISFAKSQLPLLAFSALLFLFALLLVV